MSERENLDVSSLLTIDVDAELRKLSSAQIEGSWQIPAELVRRSIRYDAGRVEVSIARQRVEVLDDGRALERDTLELVAVLLERDAEPGKRHAALVALEERGALAWLALVGARPRRVLIETPGERGLTLRWSEGSRAEVRAMGSPAPTQTRVRIEGLRVDRARAQKWLAAVCRFARPSVSLDGDDLPRGFASGVMSGHLPAPFIGHYGVPQDPSHARVWLLWDGIVSSHVTVPDVPAFCAAVEMRPLAPEARTPGDLRHALRSHLPALALSIIDALIERGREGPALAPDVRTRLATVLLQSAQRRTRGEAIAQLPLFRGFEPDGRERFFDLLTMRRCVAEEGGSRVLSALLPGQDPSAFAPAGPLFVLDDHERDVLGRLLDLAFRLPSRREPPSTNRDRIRRFWRGDLRRRLRRLIDSVRPLPTPLDEGEWSDAECGLVGALRSFLGDATIEICEGGGPVRRSGERILLPRHNAAVRAAVRIVAEDPRWVYPATLALLDGIRFPAAARRRWSVAAWMRSPSH